jgi:exosortase
VRKEAASRMGDRRATVPTALMDPPGPWMLVRRFWARRPAAATAAILVSLATLWSYWPTFVQLYSSWVHDPQYSHGLLVPAFAVGLMWLRRERFPVKSTPAVLPGLLLIALGAACRLFGGFMYVEWCEAVALVPTSLGLALVFGGWPVLRWSAPAVLFLIFMIPIPYRMTIWLGFPLQQLATNCSTYVLQTLGLPAVAEGNTILIRDFQLSIVKACSGLSMLVTFITFSTAVCLVVDKPFSDKLLILLSAIPIALVANVLRIVATGLMFLHVSNQAASAVFHDAAGWIMMPLALAFLGAELWVLNHLFIETRGRPAFR